MPQNVAGIVTRQIEVAVVGQIDRCCLVSGGFEIDAKFIVIVERIRNFDLHGTRIAFLAIRTGVAEDNPMMVHKRFRFPENLVKSLKSAMQSIGTIIGSQHIVFAIEGKARLGNPVSHTAYSSPKVRMASQITFNGVKSQRDIDLVA